MILIWMTTAGLTKTSFHLDSILPITCWQTEQGKDADKCKGQTKNHPSSFAFESSSLGCSCDTLCILDIKIFLGLQYFETENTKLAEAECKEHVISLLLHIFLFPRAFMYANITQVMKYCTECHSV